MLLFKVDSVSRSLQVVLLVLEEGVCLALLTN
jgi:hypothetical protein